MSYCASYPKQLLFSSLGCVVDGKWWRGPAALLGWEIPWHLWVPSWWSGNSGGPHLGEFGEFMPCTLPSSSFACLAPRASGFPSLPPALLFAVTDLPEMLKAFAVLLFRVKDIFPTWWNCHVAAKCPHTTPPSPSFPCSFSQKPNHYTSYIFYSRFCQIPTWITAQTLLGSDLR